MRIPICCSYCNTVVTINAAQLSCAKHRCEKQLTFQCPTCDSKTEVWIDTKRVGKGKRKKAEEAKAKAEHQVKIDAAKERNEEIALQLLAEPGCDCAGHKPDLHSLRYSNARPDGLHSGSVSYGIPSPPRHRYGCPRYDAAPRGK